MSKSKGNGGGNSGKGGGQGSGGGKGGAPKGNPGWPAKTNNGNDSGRGRLNNPPKK